MNILPILSQLFIQLEDNYIKYSKLISNKGVSSFNVFEEELLEKVDKIKILISVIKKEIQKCINKYLI